MRHGVRTAVAAVGVCALLSGCSGSSSSEPTAATGRTRHPSSAGSVGRLQHPDEPGDLGGDDGTDVGVDVRTFSTLRFSPKSDGRHSHTCTRSRAASPSTTSTTR